MTADLITFLRARLDEDERTARATLWDGSGNEPSWDLPASATVDCGGDQFYAGDRTIANHIVRHDPARVLADVGAKRRTLIRCEEELLAGVPRLTHFIQQTVWEMSLPYAGHPDYREDWRP